MHHATGAHPWAEARSHDINGWATEALKVGRALLGTGCGYPPKKNNISHPKGKGNSSYQTAFGWEYVSSMEGIVGSFVASLTIT